MSSLWNKPMLLLFTAPLLVLIVMFISYQHQQPPSITQFNVHNHFTVTSPTPTKTSQQPPPLANQPHKHVEGIPSLKPHNEHIAVIKQAAFAIPEKTPVSPTTNYAASSVDPHQHHVRMTNVCYREGYFDSTVGQYIQAKMMFYQVDENQQKSDNTKYWSKLDRGWGMKPVYEPMTEKFPPPDTAVLKGNTFFYTLFNDNIAQFYQELVCHMPVLLNDDYRAKTGYSDHLWNNFYAPHIRYKYAAEKINSPAWCQTQVKWLTEAIDIRQPSMPKMLLIDEPEAQAMQRNLSSPLKPVMCFEDVVIYQPGSCNGLSGPYPKGTNETYAHLKNYVLNKLGLAKTRPCASKVIIYDRYDAPRRRLLNAPEIKAQFETWIKSRPNTGEVTVEHVASLPTNIFDQAQYFNDADIVIQPHSASNYNALFMHDGAVHLEIGQHGTWFGDGMAPYITTGLEYKRFDFGWDLIEWNPKFDNQEFAGERSFRAKPELVSAMWQQVQHRFCNKTQ